MSLSSNVFMKPLFEAAFASVKISVRFKESKSQILGVKIWVRFCLLISYIHVFQFLWNEYLPLYVLARFCSIFFFMFRLMFCQCGDGGDSCDGDITVIERDMVMIWWYERDVMMMWWYYNSNLMVLSYLWWWYVGAMSQVIWWYDGEMIALWWWYGGIKMHFIFKETIQSKPFF